MVRIVPLHAYKTERRTTAEIACNHPEEKEEGGMSLMSRMARTPSDLLLPASPMSISQMQGIASGKGVYCAYGAHAL